MSYEVKINYLTELSQLRNKMHTILKAIWYKNKLTEQAWFFHYFVYKDWHTQIKNNQWPDSLNIIVNNIKQNREDIQLNREESTKLHNKIDQVEAKLDSVQMQIQELNKAVKTLTSKLSNKK